MRKLYPIGSRSVAISSVESDVLSIALTRSGSNLDGRRRSQRALGDDHTGRHLRSTDLHRQFGEPVKGAFHPERVDPTLEAVGSLGPEAETT